MKNLIIKEFRLAVHPTMWLFLLFSFMLLIPSYPYYVGFLYGCLAIFFTFQNGRESRDIFYTALLPIRKRDAVTARFASVMLFELAQILVSVPIALLSRRINPAGNAAGIEANVAFYGLVFLMFGGYHLAFFPAFYRDAHSLTRSMLGGFSFVILYILVAESLAQYIPGPISDYLDRGSAAAQLPVLIAGILLWLGASAWAWSISCRRFERVDL